MNLDLPKTLLELSNTTNENYPVDNWSGAVVFLIVEDSILFIKRSEEMPSHKGQIAFFGGHRQDGELEPKETAFREFEEESGISSNQLKFLGLAHGVRTSRNRIIISVVCRFNGSKQEFLKRATSNGEWTELILTKIGDLENKLFWKKALINKSYYTYFFPLNHYNSLSTAASERFAFVLWGATAKMILLFFKNYDLSGN